MHKRIPKSNTDFWIKKLNKNAERDKEVTKHYLDKGWHIKRVWEHEIKQDFDGVIKGIKHFITQAKKEKEISRRGN